MAWAEGVEPPEARFGPSYLACLVTAAACVTKRCTKPGPTPTPASPCTFRVIDASMLTSPVGRVRHGLATSHATTASQRRLRGDLAKPSANL